MSAIAVGNIAESDVRRSDVELQSDDWQAWLNASHQLADRALFWAGDNKIVLTATPYDSLWLSDMLEWLEWSHVETRCPQTTSIYISDDIFADSKLMADLQKRVGGKASTTLTGWGVTKGMYRLLQTLRESGNVQIPEFPAEEQFDLGLHFDSKSGFRLLCEKLSREYPQIRVPAGYICQDAGRLMQVISSEFLAHGHAFALKADYRSGGSGVFIYRQEQVRNQRTEVFAEIQHGLVHNNFLTPPFVVELYIPNDGCPTSHLGYHGLILPNGQVQTVGINGMVVEGESYRGALVDDEVLGAKLRQEITLSAEIMADSMATQGYRGRFNLDFVVSEQNEPYVLECNVARRGATAHIFELLEFLQTKNPEFRSVMTHDHFSLLSSRPLSYQDIRPVFTELRHNPAGLGCLSLPLIVSTLQNQEPYMGYMVIGPNHQAVSQAKKQLEDLLRQQVASL